MEFKEKVKHKAWQVGMDAKMASIISNITWELCQLPLRKYVVGLKWIYKIKCNVEVVRQKARLVAKGYSQKYVIDYEEIFSPVACMENVRLVLAFAAHAGWHVYHFVVKIAFLNEEIQEEAMWFN